VTGAPFLQLGCCFNASKPISGKARVLSYVGLALGHQQPHGDAHDSGASSRARGCVDRHTPRAASNLMASPAGPADPLGPGDFRTSTSTSSSSSSSRPHR
jgi:hypothetical protein